MINNVMIDLETFGTRSNSVIVTIGAIQFDPYDSGWIGRRFHQAIDVGSALDRGLKINGSTILWWMEQSDQAREALILKAATALDIMTVLFQFKGFIRDVKGDNPTEDVLVWGNGADFDLALLQDAYEAISVEKPWKYNASRCYRTMRSLFGVESDVVAPTLAHDALADAIAQAKTLQNIFARIEGRTGY